MKKALITSGTCFALLLILFIGTDPNKVPSFILVLPFILLFALLFLLISLFLQEKGVSRAKSVRIGMLFAAIPLILLVLQSIGQLTIKDVLTIAALFAVSYFYISRVSTSS